MKKILFLLLICFPLWSYSQAAPLLTNIIVTPNKISGNADRKAIVMIEIDISGIKNDVAISVNYKGYFEYAFNPALTQQKIKIWTVNEAGKEPSTSIEVIVQSPETILNLLSKGEIKLPINTPPVVNSSSTPINPFINDAQPESSTFSYKVTMLNTNFTIPIARFNLTKDDDSKKGDILLFNSVGAGLGISWGELEKTTDDTGKTINTEFTNTFGFHFGILFSAGSSSTENKNIFAPTFAVSTLDYQVGIGYEMGTLEPNQRRVFFTVAYAIPLSKLLKAKYYIFKASRGYNSKNPLPDINYESVRRFIQ